MVKVEPVPCTDFTEIEDDVDADGYGMNFKAYSDAVCGGAGTAPCTSVM